MTERIAPKSGRNIDSGIDPGVDHGDDECQRNGGFMDPDRD